MRAEVIEYFRETFAEELAVGCFPRFRLDHGQRPTSAILTDFGTEDGRLSTMFSFKPRIIEGGMLATAARAVELGGTTASSGASRRLAQSRS